MDSTEHKDEPTQQGLLHPALQSRDKQILHEAAHRLLAHGSILRGRSAERVLYDWCIEHQEWLEEWGTLLGVKVVVQRNERLIMALPEVPSLTRKLRRDETLVALALWYDYDVEVRENGAHEVYLSVRDFNELFRSKFPAIQPLSASRLKEILRGFARLNLVEIEWTDAFADSVVQILPTLRLAIPFPDIAEWLKVKEKFDAEPDVDPAAQAAAEEVAEANEDIEDADDSGVVGLEEADDDDDYVKKPAVDEGDELSFDETITVTVDEKSAFDQPAEEAEQEEAEEGETAAELAEEEIPADEVDSAGDEDEEASNKDQDA